MFKIPDLNLPKLTEQQKEAVECDIGPVILMAKVGSGKTWVIANRFRYLNRVHKIPVQKILCISTTKFTSKSAKEKIRHYMTVDDKKLRIMTFYDLCKKILNDIYKEKNMQPKTFVHSSKFVKIVRQILEEHKNIHSPHQVVVILEELRLICKSKNRKFTEEDLESVVRKTTNLLNNSKILSKFTFKGISEIYDKFDQELTKRNWGTLNEIILDVIPYLKDEIFINKWGNMFEAILCDEFQDLNDAQFKILVELCQNNNLFCAGDPDQSVYGYMGALPEIFIKLKNHFADLGIKVQIKKLEKNFRSTPQILEVASKLIGSQGDLSKELFTNKSGGPEPDINILDSREKQAKVVMQKIQELKNLNPELEYSDIIVLGRNRSNYKHIKSECFSFNIPFEDWNEISPILKTTEVQDLIAWVSAGFYIESNKTRWEEAIKRIYNKPKIGLGEEAFKKLLEKSKRTSLLEQIKNEADLNNTKVARLYFKIKKMQNIVEEENLNSYEKFKKIAIESEIYEYYINSGESNKSSNIKNFLNLIKAHRSKSLDETLDYLHKQNDDSVKKLIFSTIHGIKGLEFKHVLLVSVSDDNFPLKRIVDFCQEEEQKEKLIQEERRLIYVACTRALKTLHLFSDSGEENKSRFIEDFRHNLKREIMEPCPEIIENEDEIDFLEDILYNAEKLNFMSEEDKS